MCKSYIDEIEVKNDLVCWDELDILRHFSKLAKRTYGINDGFYPLGSCTMKYNPVINEKIASLFTNDHPYIDLGQGNLAVMHELGEILKKLTGLDGISLQPSAGAHGELTGMLIMRKYFKIKGEKRDTILIPDSAHGTNPSSAHIAGFKVVTLKSNDSGNLSLESLKKHINPNVAALMLTNPNTIGSFEPNLTKIAKILHDNGSFLYCDGANFNAIMGWIRVADFGVDLIQFNLHKTFSTPHGGGGPGSGPLAVCNKLVDFLPSPIISKEDREYYLDYNIKHSIGKIKVFYGNFGVIVKALAYIRMLGLEGLKETSAIAVLNANYLKELFKKHFNVVFTKDRLCMHEFVIDESVFAKYGVKTMEIAKRLMDYGIHPPTVYFPLIVKGAMMIEPTETESKQVLDNFYNTLLKILDEIKTNKELIQTSPHKTPVKKVDEALATKKLLCS